MGLFSRRCPKCRCPVWKKLPHGGIVGTVVYFLGFRYSVCSHCFAVRLSWWKVTLSIQS